MMFVNRKRRRIRWAQRSVIAALVAAVFAPVYYLFGDGVAWQASGAEVLSLAVMALLLVWRHRENINRLMAGTESKLGSKKP